MLFYQVFHLGQFCEALPEAAGYVKTLWLLDHRVRSMGEGPPEWVEGAVQRAVRRLTNVTALALGLRMSLKFRDVKNEEGLDKVMEWVRPFTVLKLESVRLFQDPEFRLLLPDGGKKAVDELGEMNELLEKKVRKMLLKDATVAGEGKTSELRAKTRACLNSLGASGLHDFPQSIVAV